METSTKLVWQSGMAFEAEAHGHSFKLDAAQEHGGQDLGTRPKTLLLTALAGCTGMDVVSILGKMRVNFEALKLEVTGQLTDEHPKIYNKINIIYRFKGKDLDITKLERAVDLSLGTYCGVAAMLGKSAEISHAIKIDG